MLLELDKWRTDYEKDIYDKETNFKSGLSLEIKGHREGRNEVGELWNEDWYGKGDGSQTGWCRRTEKYEQGIK